MNDAELRTSERGMRECRNTSECRLIITIGEGCFIQIYRRPFGVRWLSVYLSGDLTASDLWEVLPSSSILIECNCCANSCVVDNEKKKKKIGVQLRIQRCYHRNDKKVDEKETNDNLILSKRFTPQTRCCNFKTQLVLSGLHGGLGENRWKSIFLSKDLWIGKTITKRALYTYHLIYSKPI